MIDQLPELAKSEFDAPAFIKLVANGRTRYALRYLTAPPVSDADLKTLSEVNSFTAACQTPATAARLRDLVFRLLDPKRFPWIAENRAPSAYERDAAILASTALVAARKIETFRRTDAKNRQEGSVKDLLTELKFTEIRCRTILTAADAPNASEFMGEAHVAGAKADIVAGLPDGRTLIIECKATHSTANSYKRIVHDTGGKSTIWYQQFGRANILVTAVISGVISPANLEHVQNDKDVFLFWAHRLDDLKSFLGKLK